MKKGIDVSRHNEYIDWVKIKPQIDFAILRIGYGDNINSQDDSRFKEYLQGCIDNNIKFGVYLYSYATNREHLDSEILHTKRILETIPVKPFCVYYDMEDKTTEFLGKDTLTNYAITFCNEIKKLGYKTGVYANEWWFNNFLDCKKIYNEGNSIWVAKYSNNKPNIPVKYDIWQYTSDGHLEGINGRVDMNTLYEEITIPLDQYTDEQLAYKVLKGEFGNGEDRKKALGNRYQAVQNIVNQKLGIGIKITIGTKVKTIKEGNGASDGSSNRARSGMTGIVTKIKEGAKYPYLVSNKEPIGWYKKDALKII